MEKRITADDFFTGLFSAMALKGFTVLSLRNDVFDKAVERVFQKLESIAKYHHYDLRFRIQLHPVHRDSSVVRDSITNAARRDLISLDNPVYPDIRLKISPDEAE